MAAVRDFFDEVDRLFGFFFDVGLACHTARKEIERVQLEFGSSDESPFIVRDGPPVGTPEEEIEKSLHSTTIGALKQRLNDPGFDLMQAAHSVVVFTYHIWDEKYRAAIALERGVEVKDIQVDIFGDLRILRNSIIHNKGFAADDVSKCKTLTRFKPGDRIEFHKRDVEFVIRQLRQQLSTYA